MSNTNTNTAATTKRSAKKAPTKKVLCGRIYKRMNARKNVPAPAKIKAEMVEKVGVSQYMAANYYHRFLSGQWEV